MEIYLLSHVADCICSAADNDSGIQALIQKILPYVHVCGPTDCKKIPYMGEVKYICIYFMG